MEGEKQNESVKSDYSGAGAWLDAHHDPVASLYTFCSCLALEDLDGDGDYKLLVGDLGLGQHNAKLKIYKGTSLVHETQLLDLPTALCTFMMDVNEPAVAVSSGTNVFIYKTIRPYFKFTLPLLEVNSREAELWLLVKEDKLDSVDLRESLESLSNGTCDPPLTTRSMTYLQLEPEDFQPFINVFKQIPLKRQTVVTCMTVLNKTHTDEGAVSCLVVGSENKALYVLDPAAFTYLSRTSLPDVPVFLSAVGVFDVDYSISAACRDSSIYNIKKDSNAFPRIPLSSQACGLIREDKVIIVGTMTHALSCYTLKGKCMWSIRLPDSITAMEKFHHKVRNFKAVMVALGNKEVRVYKDRYLVNKISMDEIIVSMRFGRFGREDNSLVLIGQSGTLNIKILRRGMEFEPKELTPGAPLSQTSKLNIPKKTKVFVDQTIRERENAQVMHQMFQRDLLHLRLHSSQSYIKALQSNLTPMAGSKHSSLNISAHVQGVGPVFKIIVTLQNTSPNKYLIDHYLLFQCDQAVYSICKKMLKLPMLVSSVSYTFSTMIECLNDYGQTDIIKVFVHSSGNPIPLLTAIIDMPISEGLVM